MDEDSAISNLYSEEIRNAESAQFFLEWLLDPNSYESTSGDSYFLEKKEDKILIGNLFEENFEETLVSKQILISYLQKIISLKR
ncbi:MAG: hypothetical protein QM802_15230 [Agriterribacter sp.]